MSVLLTSRVVGTCASGNCTVLAGGAGVGADAAPAAKDNTKLYGTLALIAFGVAIAATYAKRSIDEEADAIESDRTRIGPIRHAHLRTTTHY